MSGIPSYGLGPKGAIPTWGLGPAAEELDFVGQGSSTMPIGQIVGYGYVQAPDRHITVIGGGARPEETAPIEMYAVTGVGRSEMAVGRIEGEAELAFTGVGGSVLPGPIAYGQGSLEFIGVGYFEVEIGEMFGRGSVWTGKRGQVAMPKKKARWDNYISALEMLDEDLAEVARRQHDLVQIP